MTTTVCQYNLFCIDENKTVSVWETDAPTKCPNDTTHQINPASVYVAGIIAENKVNINNEEIPFGSQSTGGFYKGDSIVMDCKANTVTEYDMIKKFPISVNSLQIDISADNIGDDITIVTKPDTVVGALALDCDNTSTTITAIVSNTALPYLIAGFALKLRDTANLNDLGYIINKTINGSDEKTNTSNITLTFTKPITNSFTAGTTQILIERVIIEKLYCHIQGQHIFGKAKLGSSYLPANTCIRLKYNNTSSQDKKIAIHYEYYF